MILQNSLVPNLQMSWMPSGKLIAVAGRYYDTLCSAQGCDSLRFIMDVSQANTIIKDAKVFYLCRKLLPVTLCKKVNANGVYRDILKNANTNTACCALSSFSSFCLLNFNRELQLKISGPFSGWISGCFYPGLMF